MLSGIRRLNKPLFISYINCIKILVSVEMTIKRLDHELDLRTHYCFLFPVFSKPARNFCLTAKSSEYLRILLLLLF